MSNTLLLALLLSAMTASATDLSGWFIPGDASALTLAMQEFKAQPPPPHNRFSASAQRSSLYPTLTRTEQAFVQWNALRLGIDVASSASRYNASAQTFGVRGFNSAAYRTFCVTGHSAFSVLAADSPDEMFDAYRLFAPFHTLRLVSYMNPCGTALHVEMARHLISSFPDATPLEMIDYGCGMAQESRCLAEMLRVQGRQVKLHLFDIPTPRKSLLAFTCQKFDGFACEMHDVTQKTGLPVAAHAVIATEVLEHMQPAQTSHFRTQLLGALVPHGLFRANIGEHAKEFMHVDAKISQHWPSWLRQHGFSTVRNMILYRRDVGLSYTRSSRKRRADVATQPERASAPPASPTTAPTVRAETAATASAALRPQYQPSTVERKWARLVAEVDPRECEHAWANGSRLVARLERDVASNAVFEQSSSFTVVLESQGATLNWPIEPLVSFLRWPAALALGHATRAAIMNKSYYQLAPVREGSRRLFFDIGASLYSSSWAGGDGSASLRWFWSRYQNLTGSPQPFDHIYAWEAREYRATVLWDSFPAEVVPFVSYYNVPADARPNARHNPLRVLTQVARPDDHVVIKLDVDHQATQVALIQQVLGNRRISALIDELFWEHEVAGSAMGCPRLWGGRAGSGWSTIQFDTAQGRGGTLAESYELFGRLRSLGIAAHSWV